jgi:hypothetical protein
MSVMNACTHARTICRHLHLSMHARTWESRSRRCRPFPRVPRHTLNSRLHHSLPCNFPDPAMAGDDGSAAFLCRQARAAAALSSSFAKCRHGEKSYYCISKLDTCKHQKSPARRAVVEAFGSGSEGRRAACRRLCGVISRRRCPRALRVANH